MLIYMADESQVNHLFFLANFTGLGPCSHVLWPTECSKSVRVLVSVSDIYFIAFYREIRSR